LVGTGAFSLQAFKLKRLFQQNTGRTGWTNLSAPCRRACVSLVGWKLRRFCTCGHSRWWSIIYPSWTCPGLMTVYATKHEN